MKKIKPFDKNNTKPSERDDKMIEDSLKLSKIGRKVSKEIDDFDLLEDLESLEERFRKYTVLIQHKYVDLSEEFKRERFCEASKKVITRGDYDLMYVLGIGHGKMDAAYYSVKSAIAEYKLLRDKLSEVGTYGEMTAPKTDDYEKSQ